jgi:hypothetical protein
MLDIALFASVDDLPRRTTRAVVRQFGGIKVFAASSSALNTGVDCICQCIIRVSNASWGLTPSLLKYLTQQELKVEVSKRVFSALLGHSLRCGVLDAIICEGSQGTAFRIIMHRDRIGDFGRRTQEVSRHLYKRRALQVSELRDTYFNTKPKGSWTQAMYMAARLVRLGIAEYQDQYSIKMPDVVANAVVHSVKPFDTVDTGWVGAD